MLDKRRDYKQNINNRKKKLDAYENYNKRTRIEINELTTHRSRRSRRALTIKNYPSAMHIDRERNPEEKRVGIRCCFKG